MTTTTCSAIQVNGFCSCVFSCFLQVQQQEHSERLFSLLCSFALRIIVLQASTLRKYILNIKKIMAIITDMSSVYDLLLVHFTDRKKLRKLLFSTR